MYSINALGFASVNLSMNGPDWYACEKYGYSLLEATFFGTEAVVKLLVPPLFKMNLPLIATRGSPYIEMLSQLFGRDLFPGFGMLT